MAAAMLSAVPQTLVDYKRLIDDGMRCPMARRWNWEAAALWRPCRRSTRVTWSAAATPSGRAHSSSWTVLYE